MERVRAGASGGADHSVGVEEVDGVRAVRAGATARIPSRSQVRVMRGGDLAAVRDEDGPVGDRAAGRARDISNAPIA